MLIVAAAAPALVVTETELKTKAAVTLEVKETVTETQQHHLL